MFLLTDAARSLTSATGATLATLVRGLSAVRRPEKPMHPYGAVRAGRLHRRGGPEPLGAVLTDQAGVDEVLARESRAIGLPASWPDIHAIAVRLPDGGGDLLFSGTGSGPLSRHLLTLTRGPERGRMGTLFPFRSASGPVVLSARYLTQDVVELSWARVGGDWHPFADLVLGPRRPDDPELVFDAVLNTPPGLPQYDAVRRLRAPSYAAARASRDR